MKQAKICFNLLNYRTATHRHYYHIYEFIEALGLKADVRLHVMDAQEPPVFESPTKVLDLTGRGFIATIRRCSAIISARFQGYSIFYHHYTTGPARFSALLNRLAGGRTYLWHCIVMDALDDIVQTNKLQRYLLRLTFRMIHHLVTGTDYMADYYAARYPLRRDTIRVIPNYINLKRFDRSMVNPREIPDSLGIDPEKKIVLYLHEIEEGRAALLPEIIAAVIEKRNDIVFIIAGDGHYRAALEKRLKEWIDGGAVFMIGKIPNIDTPKYYGCANLYIMTSSFEAFSRVLLEAMAMGVPYIATDGGGNIRTYTPADHQEFILSKENWYLFPDKIIQLLDDPEQAQAFSDAGHRHVQQFSLDKIVDLFLNTIT
ncbi:glycosyltransferase family 4 protein [bacterium]|nr:glycosyltransferase family 4 protein [candidate division CSSED10-310 bacterium]